MSQQIRVKEIANQCMVSRTTVLRWIKQDKLQAIRLPSGHYRIKYMDFEDFLKKYEIL